jgi:hypothetical protein
MQKTKLKGKFTIYYLDYPKIQGSGGWSSSAKHKPQPELVAVTDASSIYFKGESVYFDTNQATVRKLKATIIRNVTGEIIREDYPVNQLLSIGAKDSYPALSKAS